MTLFCISMPILRRSTVMLANDSIISFCFIYSTISTEPFMYMSSGLFVLQSAIQTVIFSTQDRRHVMTRYSNKRQKIYIGKVEMIANRISNQINWWYSRLTFPKFARGLSSVSRPKAKEMRAAETMDRSIVPRLTSTLLVEVIIRTWNVCFYM